MDKCNTECNIIRSVNTNKAHDRLTLQIKLTRVTVRLSPSPHCLFKRRGVRSVCASRARRQLWINVCEIMLETEKEIKSSENKCLSDCGPQACGRSQARVMTTTTSGHRSESLRESGGKGEMCGQLWSSPAYCTGTTRMVLV